MCDKIKGIFSILVFGMFFLSVNAFAAQQFGFHQRCKIYDTPMNINVILNLADKNANYVFNIMYAISDSAAVNVSYMAQLPVFAGDINGSKVQCQSGCGYYSGSGRSAYADNGVSGYQTFVNEAKPSTTFGTSVVSPGVTSNVNTNVVLPTRALKKLRIEGFISPGYLGAYERNQYVKNVQANDAFYEPFIVDYVAGSRPGTLVLSGKTSRTRDSAYALPTTLDLGRHQSLNLSMQGYGADGWFNFFTNFNMTEWASQPDCVN